MNEEKWFCPQKEIAVTIKYHFDCGYYTETIDYIEFGKTWDEGVKTLVKFHTKRELCLPYDENWSIYKKIGHDNPKLTGTWSEEGWGDDGDSVYTEQNEMVKERVYSDCDYVVMGKIGKENWIKDLWVKLGAVT